MTRGSIDKKDNKVKKDDDESDGDVQSITEGIQKLGLEDLTDEQKESLEELKLLDGQRNEKQKEFLVEMTVLKAKYNKLFAPIYDKRAQRLQVGTAEEIDGTPALPRFWLTVLRNHRQLSEMIEKYDETPLCALKNISSKDDVDLPNSFTITFEFIPNNYFEETILTKKYNILTEESSGRINDDVLSSTESTVITWKPAMDVTKKKVTRKQKNKRTRATRKITEVISVPSFFNFFRSHEIPSESKLEEMKDKEIEELEVIFEADYQAGCIIREKIIPQAVGWYTGDAYDSDVPDSSTKSMGSSDDEDDDSDKEEERSEDMQTLNRKPVKDGEKNPQEDCKQQ
eukprot:GHVR01000962.1.p1 GENE.GHVR01000962.1~~GHVR01000962.1.p1  ORF type:complete len:342 (+),score=84.83 GHVR01000962.1:91-1116(+)